MLFRSAAARAVNEQQPYETIQTALRIFGVRTGQNPKVVTLFGVAFKGIPETNDLRGTMAAAVYAAVRKECPDAQVKLFDPAALRDEVHAMFPDATVVESVQEALADSDLLLITNNNPAFGKRRIEELLGLMGPQAIIYDYWNHFARIRAQDRGDRHFSVGGLEPAYDLLFGAVAPVGVSQ